MVASLRRYFRHFLIKIPALSDNCITQQLQAHIPTKSITARRLFSTHSSQSHSCPFVNPSNPNPLITAEGSAIALPRHRPARRQGAEHNEKASREPPVERSHRRQPPGGRHGRLHQRWAVPPTDCTTADPRGDLVIYVANDTSEVFQVYSSDHDVIHNQTV